MFTIAGSYQLPPPDAMILPMSNNMTCYYSFDTAQQVNYYNHSYITMIQMLSCPLSAYPFQPSHICLLTPRKCAIFGIKCEYVPRQVCALYFSMYVLYIIMYVNVFIVIVCVCTCYICMCVQSTCVYVLYVSMYYMCTCICNSCNMGMMDMTDMYAQGPSEGCRSED